ncbi:MAG: ABC transporter permease, partial [Anaerolineae bacterium]|nr:ABC transporter permease [Anaerolineae bacterium]
MNATPAPLHTEPAEKTKIGRRVVVAASLREAGTLIGLIALMIFFASQSPIFLTERNLINILQQSSINACIAIGMTLVIISGGIDLSVGAVAALTGVITADLMFRGVPVPLAMLAGTALGIGCGVVNGLLISRAKLQPFIATLGTMSVFRALALIYTGGNPILSVPPDYRAFFTGTVGPLPMSVVIVAVMAVL